MTEGDKLPILLPGPPDPDRPARRGPDGCGAARSLLPTEPDRRDPLARRILVLHLPDLAMERYLRHRDRNHEPLPDDLPAALAVDGPHGPVIHATNRAARAEGLRLGARVVDMRALCPHLHVGFADLAGDRAMRDRLMLWSRRWCPWTAPDGAQGLVMDSTGSAHLWGGEAAMLRDMEAKFALMGLSVRLAIAPTHGAAWALARLGGVREICGPDDLAARMAPLPIRALRLMPDARQVLNRLGLKTVGELAAVPRLSLARRFARAALAENPLMRLDQMMGRLAEPVQSPDDPPQFIARAVLAEPVQDPTPHLPGLAEALCADLAARDKGARQITLRLYRSDGAQAALSVTTARPSREAAHLLRLFEGRLDRLDPGFGFDLLTLEAASTEALAPAQTRLDGAPDPDRELARLVDRLVARLGTARVMRPAPQDSHIPERRERWHPAMAPPAPDLPSSRRPRPLALFDPPEEIRVLYAVPEGPPAQFIWRRVTHKVTRFAGPERIAPEWWADRPGTRLRDYYRIEDHEGRRFWLYREGLAHDGRGGAPRWFLHGVFP